MTISTLQNEVKSISNVLFGSRKPRTAASYERELEDRAGTESKLRQTITADQVLLAQKELLIEQLEVLGKESDHRLLNGLQLIASLIALQGRKAASAEVSSQLAGAAERVNMIARVHQRLHCLDGAQTVAFKKYLQDLCHDFSAMLSPDERTAQEIVCEGADLDLPTVTAIPLGYVVSELITNAVKHGKGRITVRLDCTPDKRHTLSVSNEGQSLPENFDPAESKGLGMRIVRSFVAKVGGELRIDRGEGNDRTRFTVLFS